MEDSLLNTLINTSPLSGVCLLIAYWFKQISDKNIEKLDAERKERTLVLEQCITDLQKRSDNCEKDRLEMSKQIYLIKEAQGLKFSLFDERKAKEGE